MAKYNYTHPPPPFIPVCVTPLPYRLPPSPSSPHPHTHSSALHSPKSRHVCLIVSENRCRKTAIRASSPCFCSFSLCMAVSTLSPQFVSVMLYRFRLSKYERYPLDCYHSNQNVNRNPSLNSASLLFRLLGELDVLVRFWWGSSPALPPPPTQLPNISMAALHSQRLTETRGERERWLLCILRASLRTIPQDVLLSRAWTDAALTSAIQEHTHTQRSPSPPHSS